MAPTVSHDANSAAAAAVGRLSSRLSHADYCAACSRIALATREVAKLRVQVRIKGGVICGQVEQLGEWAEAGEWFRVATPVGSRWVESRNVRLCSGDGRCTCEVAQ